VNLRLASQGQVRHRCVSNLGEKKANVKREVGSPVVFRNHRGQRFISISAVGLQGWRFYSETAEAAEVNIRSRLHTVSM
jgi:hypothetical protein